ncbi:MAG TPA: hypothetical protein VF190_13290 [Rhodothermales bacterium]
MIPRKLRWDEWEAVIRTNGITIDRPRGSVHPRYPDIIYPLDYGYVRNTLSTDAEELDIFRGGASNGLVAAIFTTDYRRGDRECKLIFDASPIEIYLVNGFINFDRTLMEGTLVMRYPMQSLWRGQESATIGSNEDPLHESR